MAHASWSAKTSRTRRTELSINPQFTTYKPPNSVQTTGATALSVRQALYLGIPTIVLWAGPIQRWSLPNKL
jgi:hypothetical protein